VAHRSAAESDPFLQPGSAVGVDHHHVRMWIAQDDRKPVRRISFGENRARAEQLAESLEGWSVRSDSDQHWLPVTGSPPASETAEDGH